MNRKLEKVPDFVESNSPFIESFICSEPAEIRCALHGQGIYRLTHVKCDKREEEKEKLFMNSLDISLSRH